jgi:hypothetical protein
VDFDHLLNTAFEQIRHYAVSDIAVSLLCCGRSTI